ncbi:MAG: Smr/MutS family protein [Acidobacteriota bacterium]
MTLASLLKSFRKVFAASQNRESLDEKTDVADETDEDFDPMNPFPDPVVIEFRDVLDLHSIPPKQIRAVLEDYLEEACARRVRYLRIIHGKGIGVQREIVRSILADKAYVKEFRDAPMEAGSWGATIVELKTTID